MGGRRCVVCGASAATTRQEPYRYDEAGLPFVTLADVEVTRCGACGDVSALIRRVPELHRALALAIAQKPTKLLPAELRHLRKWMDWSTAECAGYMGVTRETVSRWESGAIPIGDTADRLVRGLVALKAAAPVPLDVFRDVTGPATPQRLTAHFTEAAGWRTELAPAPDRAVARPKAGRPRAATSRGARGKHTEAKSARGSRVSR